MSVCRAWTDHYKSGVKEGIKVGEAKGMAKGLKKGELKGKIEGIVEGKAEVIANLHKAKFTIEQIAEFVNEDVEFVKKHLA